MKRLTLVAVLLAACAAWGGEAYYIVPLTEVRFPEGEQPVPAEPATLRGWAGGIWQRPYAVGAGGEEIYFYFQFPDRARRGIAAEWTEITRSRLAIRSPEGRAPSGTLFLPNADRTGMDRFEFEVDSPPAPAEPGRVDFLVAKQQYYNYLRRRNMTGTAWFRSQAEAAIHEIQTIAPDRSDVGPLEAIFMGRRESRLEDSFSLFSGGRAISENLQLDRELNVLEAGERSVDISTIEGITTEEIDWKPLIEGLSPEKDKLAALVPYDQHAVFFPTMQHMLDLMDEVEERGMPVLDMLRPRSERLGVSDRYQRQFALPLTDFARRIGPRLARSVAVTGSDTFLPTGTDVAVLFEAVDVRALRAMIAGQQMAEAMRTPGTRPVSGRAGGVPYSGFASPRREVSTYVAEVGDTVVVSNSVAQLARIAGAARGDVPSLASLDEYVFFRDRYKLGDPEESAFVVLTDAAIRRWCGPKWRIAASRRTRAAAAMAEIYARYLADVAAGKAGEAEAVKRVPGLGDVHVGPDGVWSEVYGSPAFLTPIIELEVDRITPQERDAYSWFRQQYQRQWQQFFDPIAARVSVKHDRLALDLTVLPLIAQSRYRQFMRLVGAGTIAQGAGDPHEDALFQFVMALDPESPPVRQFGSFAMGMAPVLRENPFGWLGKWAAVYVDEGPFWAELADVEPGGWGRDKRGEFIAQNISRMPAAAAAEVRNPLLLAAFLVGVRAFFEQSSPGMTVWEVMEHNGRPYTRVRPSAKSLAEMGGDIDPAFALHYGVFGGMLVLTPNAATLHRAMDRQAAREEAREAGEAPPEASPWLGESVAVRGRRGALGVVEAWMSDDLARAYQHRSWANLPILNEWRRVLGQDDPMAFHQKHWHAALICTGGGRYVWNDEFHTMESTVFGHPGQPRQPEGQPKPLEIIESVALGLTFEGDGLRAKGEVFRGAGGLR